MSESALADFHPLLDVLHAIDVGITILELDGTVKLWNGFMSHNSGFPAEDAIGKSIYDLFPKIDKPWFERKIKQTCVLKIQAFVTWEQRPYVLFFRNKRPITGQTEFMYQNATFIPLSDIRGDITQVALVIYDATQAAAARHELEDAKSQLELMGTLDNDTLFHDPASFQDILEVERQRAQRSDLPLTVAHFKFTNAQEIIEEHGTDAWAAYMQDIATALKQGLRTTDIMARPDVDELAAILVSTDKEKSKVFAQRVAGTIKNYPTTSFGVQLKAKLHSVPTDQSAYEWWPTLHEQWR
ncbi:sensor domain-containing diguanylate cyclase [Salinibius halmophilus]|uniref:sensor domain-containing diguanylate cyclase n=1 Tax=Salinibius halmophilus TaxID=1853216 RepID=UPI000E668C4A|nr:diguanylate cyclase [Salinibius halmophilus]